MGRHDWMFRMGPFRFSDDRVYGIMLKEIECGAQLTLKMALNGISMELVEEEVRSFEEERKEWLRNVENARNEMLHQVRSWKMRNKLYATRSALVAVCKPRGYVMEELKDGVLMSTEHRMELGERMSVEVPKDLPLGKYGRMFFGIVRLIGGKDVKCRWNYDGTSYAIEIYSDIPHVLIFCSSFIEYQGTTFRWEDCFRGFVDDFVRVSTGQYVNGFTYMSGESEKDLLGIVSESVPELEMKLTLEGVMP